MGIGWCRGWYGWSGWSAGGLVGTDRLPSLHKGIALLSTFLVSLCFQDGGSIGIAPGIVWDLAFVFLTLAFRL